MCFNYTTRYLCTYIGTYEKHVADRTFSRGRWTDRTVVSEGKDYLGIINI